MHFEFIHAGTEDGLQSIFVARHRYGRRQRHDITGHLIDGDPTSAFHMATKRRIVDRSARLQPPQLHLHGQGVAN
jgi:hypothetical protein